MKKILLIAIVCGHVYASRWAVFAGEKRGALINLRKGAQRSCAGPCCLVIDALGKLWCGRTLKLKFFSDAVGRLALSKSRFFYGKKWISAWKNLSEKFDSINLITCCFTSNSTFLDLFFLIERISRCGLGTTLLQLEELFFPVYSIADSDLLVWPTKANNYSLATF